jgi:hypothetical protein
VKESREREREREERNSEKKKKTFTSLIFFLKKYFEFVGGLLD